MIKKIKKIWQSLPNLKWSGLRAVEDYRVVKSMYVWLFLVPIAAKAMALLGGIADLTIFEYEFQVELGLPFTWEVFFFSAWAFVIGNLIVITRCPKILLEHSDYSTFKLQGKAGSHLLEYWRNIGKNVKDFGILWALPDQYDRNRIDEIFEARKSDTFWTIHKGAQEFRPISKWFCLISYLVGFCLIAFVLLQNLIFVVDFLLPT